MRGKPVSAIPSVRRFALLTVFGSAAIALAYPSAAKANITYNLIDYPAYENGYTLSGQIVTDGALRTLSNSDIVSWWFTATNGTITLSTGVQVKAGVVGLNASAEQLNLPCGYHSGTLNQLNLPLELGGNADMLSYQNQPGLWIYELIHNPNPPLLYGAMSCRRTPARSHG